MELNTREIQFSKNKTHVLLLRKAFFYTIIHSSLPGRVLFSMLNILIILKGLKISAVFQIRNFNNIKEL